MLQPKSRILNRFVETVDFVENKQITIDMPLGYDLSQVDIELSGTITIGTAATTLHEYVLPRLIRQIDLFSNGKNKFGELTGLMACLGNAERSYSRSLTDLATGTGAKTVRANFVLAQANLDSMRPKDSALHTVKPFMSKLQLRIQCGQFLDGVKTAGSFAVTSHTLKMTVRVREHIEFDEIAYFEDRLVKNQSIIAETISASNTSFRVKLPAGELLTRGVKIYALDETGALSNSIINGIQLKSGVDVAYSRAGDECRQDNLLDYGLPVGQQPVGFYFADMCEKGMLNTLWDTRGLSEVDLILDVTKPAGGNGTVVVVPQHFYAQPNVQIRAELLKSQGQ